MAGAEANSVRLGRPARFASARVERLFLLQYRKSGVRFAKIAFLIAAGIAAAFIVLLEFWASAGQVSSPRQATRVGLLALLLLTALLLHYRPDIALRYFHACVGLPTLIASITLGAMSLVPVEGGTTGASRFVVAMSLACWLCFGFTRLPALLVLLGCGFASLLTIASSIVHGDDHAAAVAVYLVVANLIGWFMSNEIERRERSLFWKSRELMQTTRALERMAWEAREANAAKTRIMAMVCHDLRQPIGSLSLYLQLLRSNHLEAESDACMEPLRKAEACVDVLADNLTRMSEVSGLQRRRRRIELQHIDLRSVLERLELVHAVRAQCGATKLIVRVPAPGMLVARSDERRLWDVLSNLLANALKFGSSDRQPWVLIRGRRIGGAIEIYVRDNGIGIAPEHHERIFGERFRVGGGDCNHEHGYGLGLSIVRETVTLMEGHSIRLRSSLGNGSCFILRMPAAVDAPGLHEGTPERMGQVQRATPSIAVHPVIEKDGVDVRTYIAGDLDRDSKMDVQQTRAAYEAMRGPLAASPWRGTYVLFVGPDDSIRQRLIAELSWLGGLVDSVTGASDALRLVDGAERLFDLVICGTRLGDGGSASELIGALRGRLPAVPAVLLLPDKGTSSERCPPAVDGVLTLPANCGAAALLAAFDGRGGRGVQAEHLLR